MQIYVNFMNKTSILLMVLQWVMDNWRKRYRNILNISNLNFNIKIKLEINWGRTEIPIEQSRGSQRIRIKTILMKILQIWNKKREKIFRWERLSPNRPGSPSRSSGADLLSNKNDSNILMNLESSKTKSEYL